MSAPGVDPIMKKLIECTPDTLLGHDAQRGSRTDEFPSSRLSGLFILPVGLKKPSGRPRAALCGPLGNLPSFRRLLTFLVQRSRPQRGTWFSYTWNFPREIAVVSFQAAFGAASLPDPQIPRRDQMAGV
jgi:hypothetical protein